MILNEAIMSKVICFGEVLWDMLPTGKVPGGAPMNVAFHLNQFGCDCKLISKVGEDPLGKELLLFLEQRNISTRLIQKDAAHPTGTVKVTLDGQGVPDYEIIDSVSYDFIEANDKLKEIVSRADIFVYGSLAARNSISRRTLFQLLDNTGIKVCDINLRIPHYKMDVVEALLKNANIVKMNNEELDLIVSWYKHIPDFESKMRFFKDHFQLTALIITRGEKGASVLDQNDQFYHSSYPFQIDVTDTVGCGDAFLAGFVSKILAGAEIPECLEFASAVGAYLATKRGATPRLDEEVIINFSKPAK